MRIFHALLVTLFLIGLSSLQADTVILKDGTKYEGRITLQTADLVKIEVAVTDRIKENKTIPIKDVADIVKTAPDDVMFAKLQNLVPTRSMVSAENYIEMIKTGPEAFLTSFGGSKHKEKVEAIKKTLDEELEKVERGSFKLEGQWYTPQDRNDYPKLIESKIALLQMKANASGGRYLNLIASMRDYERLEREYYGTPAFAEATALAQQIIPALGRQVQGLRRDANAKIAKWESDTKALDLQSRQQVEGARAREEAQFAAAVSADKKAKIKWTRLNTWSPQTLDSYIQMASGEMGRVKAYDVALLKTRADALVAVDKEIAAGELETAAINLKNAVALPTSAAKGKTKRRSSSKKGSSRYSGALSSKLSGKIAERKAIAKAALDAKKSEALTADLKSSRQTNPDVLANTADSTKGEDAVEAKPEGDFDAFAALSTPKPKKEEPKTTTKKKSTKKTSQKKLATPRTATTSSGGGGFPKGLILPIATVLLIGAVVVLKVLGIGGKKDEE